jgi:hypothetical protein
MSDKPSHPRQLYCGRAASITKISSPSADWGAVCQLLSGLKVKICSEVTEPQKCQPQYKEQRSLELSRWRRTSDNEHPRIWRHFVFYVYRTPRHINCKCPKTKRFRQEMSEKLWVINCTQEETSWFIALLNIKSKRAWWIGILSSWGGGNKIKYSIPVRNSAKRPRGDRTDWRRIHKMRVWYSNRLISTRIQILETVII